MVCVPGFSTGGYLSGSTIERIVLTYDEMSTNSFLSRGDRTLSYSASAIFRSRPREQEHGKYQQRSGQRSVVSPPGGFRLYGIILPRRARRSGSGGGGCRFACVRGLADICRRIFFIFRFRAAHRLPFLFFGMPQSAIMPRRSFSAVAVPRRAATMASPKSTATPIPAAVMRRRSVTTRFSDMRAPRSSPSKPG